jgi:hypothetical protein
MFAPVKSEASTRLFTLDSFFRTTCTKKHIREARTAKGLAFVQMYAIYEYVVTNSVKAAILQIKNRGMLINTVRWELLSLILDADLNSVRDCGEANLWKKRIALMQKVNAAVLVDTADTAFPSDGSHFREDQLETIWSLFGISSSVVPDGRMRQLIRELVANRNAIAHGRSSPEDVGRTFSKDDIVKKIGQCRDLCMYIVNELENHCSVPANLLR